MTKFRNISRTHLPKPYTPTHLISIPPTIFHVVLIDKFLMIFFRKLQKTRMLPFSV